jgi:hypothetical protein
MRALLSDRVRKGRLVVVVKYVDFPRLVKKPSNDFKTVVILAGHMKRMTSIVSAVVTHIQVRSVEHGCDDRHFLFSDNIIGMKCNLQCLTWCEDVGKDVEMKLGPWNVLGFDTSTDFASHLVVGEKNPCPVATQNSAFIQAIAFVRRRNDTIQKSRSKVRSCCMLEDGVDNRILAS